MLRNALPILFLFMLPVSCMAQEAENPDDPFEKALRGLREQQSPSDGRGAENATDARLVAGSSWFGQITEFKSKSTLVLPVRLVVDEAGASGGPFTGSLEFFSRSTKTEVRGLVTPSGDLLFYERDVLQHGGSWVVGAVYSGAISGDALEGTWEDVEHPKADDKPKRYHGTISLHRETEPLIEVWETSEQAPKAADPRYRLIVTKRDGLQVEAILQTRSPSVLNVGMLGGYLDNGTVRLTRRSNEVAVGYEGILGSEFTMHLGDQGMLHVAWQGKRNGEQRSAKFSLEHREGDLLKLRE